MDWTRSVVQMPKDGQTPLALKLVDSRNNISYGIGWYNAREKRWWITADPQPGTEWDVAEWVALPGAGQ